MKPYLLLLSFCFAFAAQAQRAAVSEAGIKLTFGNGTTRFYETKKSKSPEDDSYQLYTLTDGSPKGGFWLVTSEGYESMSFLLVSQRDGTEWSLDGPAVLSPDKLHFVCLPGIYEDGQPSSHLFTLYTFTNNQLKTVVSYNLAPKKYVANAAWFTPDSLLVMCETVGDPDGKETLMVTNFKLKLQPDDRVVVLNAQRINGQTNTYVEHDKSAANTPPKALAAIEKLLIMGSREILGSIPYMIIEIYSREGTTPKHSVFLPFLEEETVKELRAFLHK